MLSAGDKSAEQQSKKEPALPHRGIIALTGASGYIGRATVRAALSRGYGVVALGRRPLDIPGIEFQRYDLQDDGALVIPPGCVAILHLAADTRAGSRADIDMEMKAANRIVDAAREYGMPLVFVSSQTAALTRRPTTDARSGVSSKSSCKHPAALCDRASSMAANQEGCSASYLGW